MQIQGAQVEPRSARLLPFIHLGEAWAHVFTKQLGQLQFCGEQLEIREKQGEAKLCLKLYLNSCVLSVAF